jgi:predicted unusual protein kinase regulating ubiquinone biosynthesis (AarF/ABC1/UbiB family)
MKTETKADRIKLEELIDESFRAMGEDADYRKEAVLILEQFAESNAERLALED